jgi:hypothetical protein
MMCGHVPHAVVVVQTSTGRVCLADGLTVPLLAEFFC